MSTKEIGQQLRVKREQRGLKLAEAAKATRIRSHYLHSLEEGEFGELPSAAQMRGFLRTYANFLGLDADVLLQLLSPHPTENSAAAGEAAEAKDATLRKPGRVPESFAAIGEQLRQRRSNLELTLAEVEQNTHIPEHYVDRLERGDFDSFPSPTQARGMLSNYADFLGMDSNALLLEYAEALQQRFQKRQAALPPKPKPPQPKLVFRAPPWLTNLFSRDLLFGGIAGLMLLIFVVWSIGRIAAASAGEEAEPTAPPLTGLLLSTPQATGGSPTAVGTPGSINLLEGNSPTPGLLGQVTIDLGAAGAIQLRLFSLQRTWMRVTVDGQVAFEGRTQPGDTYTFNAANQVLVLTGNASALRAFLNEQDLGILGIYGEVINVVFTREGAATPTLSPTPTIDPAILTATAGSALTPSATITPSASATPTVDAGGDNP